MEFKFAEHIKTIVVSGQRRPEPQHGMRPYVTATREYERPNMGSIETQDLIKTRIHIGYDQYVTQANTDRGREQARAAIAHYMFGEIRDEIRHAMHMLYKDGLHNHKATKHLEEIVEALE